MREFSNLNWGSTFWPPDAGQHYNSLAYPCSANPYCVPFPSFEVQGRFLQFNSSFIPPPLNTPAVPNPANNSSEPEATMTKRFLVFNHSGDQTSLLFSSVANQFEGLNPTFPVSNVNCADASNSHTSTGEDEMHENTDEIDALLYNEEESSTGHSPLDWEEEEIASSYFPAKRRRIDTPDIDPLLIDTASSALSPLSHYQPGDVVDCNISRRDDKSERRGKSKRNKREKLQAMVSVLRRIIPGGKGKDPASVLDEAIQYLKLLKLRMKAVGASSFTL